MKTERGTRSQERGVSSVERPVVPVPSTHTTPRAIELQIDTLALHGFAPPARYAIGDAVQRELGRLFAEGGVLPGLTRGGELENLDCGQVELALGAEATTIGIQVAQVVYASLGRWP